MNRLLKSLLLLSLALSIANCTKPDDILNDFDVHVNPTFYRYITITDLEQANDSNLALPSNLRINVSGDDADRIYALDGTRNFKASGNIVQLMVPTEFEPQGNLPLSFNVSASAAGYLRSNTAYSIANGQFYQSKSLTLFDKASLPSNVSFGNTSFATDPSTGMVIDTVTVSAQTDESGVSLNIPPGMRFVDSEGNIKTGKTATHYEIEIVHGEIFIAVWDGAVDLTIPVHAPSSSVTIGEGEDFSFAIVDESGEIAQLLQPPANFNPGVVHQPTIRLEVSPTLFNPETLANFKAGDRVGVKYLDGSSQTWKYISEDDYIIDEEDNGDLFVEFNLTNDSYSQDESAYKLWYSPKLNASNVYNITSNLADVNVPAVTGNLELVFEILNTNIQYTVDLGGSFNFESNPASGSNPQQSIKTLHPVVLKEIRPKSENLKNVNYLLNAKQVSNGWEIEIDYNSNIDPVTLSYRLRCDGAFIQPPVGVVMYYREHDPSNEAPFNELYRFVNNTVTQYSFTQLVDGAYYDFRAQYGPDQVDTNNVEVIDGHTYEITLPKVICNKIGF